jgi:N-acetylglucosamine-6-phosphate deacetylase
MTTATLAATVVVTADGVRHDAEIVMEDGLIVAVRDAGDARPDRVLAPGFVDLQVNGIGDVDVASADGEDWERLDAALLAQGVTTWCPTLVSAPLDSLDASLHRVARARARPERGRPSIAGAHLEGPFLAVPGAHRPSFVRDVVDAEGRAWLGALPSVARMCTIAPEVAGALDAVAAMAGRGMLVSLGHSACTAEIAGAAVDAGARVVTHVGNAMGPLHHRAPGLLGVALADDRLAVSLIADLVHSHPAFVRMVFAAKGPGGVALVTDAVAMSVHATSVAPPRLADGTLAGSVLTMPEAVGNVAGPCVVPWEDAVRAASATPAGLLGLHDRGVIEVGRRADLVALEHSAGTWRVSETWVAGLRSFP